MDHLPVTYVARIRVHFKIMGSRIISFAVQLTPHIVTVTGLLIAGMLSLYWLRAKRLETPPLPSRWFDDPEHLLLAGLLLITVGVIVGFFVLLVLSSNVFAAPVVSRMVSAMLVPRSITTGDSHPHRVK